MLSQSAFGSRGPSLAPSPGRPLLVAGVRPQLGGLQEPLGEQRLAAPKIGAELVFERRLDFAEQTASVLAVAAPQGQPGAVEGERLQQVRAQSAGLLERLLGILEVAGP